MHKSLLQSQSRSCMLFDIRSMIFGWLTVVDVVLPVRLSCVFNDNATDRVMQIINNKRPITPHISQLHIRRLFEDRRVAFVLTKLSWCRGGKFPLFNELRLLEMLPSFRGVSDGGTQSNLGPSVVDLSQALSRPALGDTGFRPLALLGRGLLAPFDCSGDCAKPPAFGSLSPDMGFLCVVAVAAWSFASDAGAPACDGTPAPSRCNAA